ncbi:hypothetical protein Poli38472_011250 [Pythium oligandrum]|uniref:CID domain-containing protein n=1 Tax=Pythium oligandrum TaxID=41045 RepID=A0A8K1CQF4_PYTOL|nr:hypothetical protein Poli38472_011250 [Pythium oligandrum]|eukprot:TMW67630.1 hypothetical protein Poli38472_011250 [Pythium oligandrum]
MAQFTTSTGHESRGSNPSQVHAGGRRAPGDVHAILSQFDAKINQMMDYPAKDVINSLTMLAERVEFASEIVSFLETKIHRAPPNYKLPIFYLTDSILKNVRGPYISLLARNIVPLYCNCVKQVSGKDLRRFLHVLNTWDSTRLFPPEALAQMRAAVNRALALAEPAAAAQPVSFSQEPPPQRRAPPAAAPPQKNDMELRSLLTQLQNDMGIHPTEHLSLEQVKVQNPQWYNQLVEYHQASEQPPAQQSMPPAINTAPPPASGGVLGSGPQAGSRQPTPPARDPRRPSRFSDVPPPRQAAPPVTEPPKSTNVSHLMDLLKRKSQPSSSPLRQPMQHPRDVPEENIITNEPARAPNAAAVMSILQKLKGLNGAGGQSAPSSGPTSNMQQNRPANDGGASKMWFSDKIVAHKDRVESNIQKLYAALPLVCRESGLRFKEQEKLNAHLDFLFQYNRAQKERGKGGVSRSWYPDEEQWVMDFSGEVAPREATSSSFFDRKESVDENQDEYENASVPVDEAITRCRICGENFTKSWDEEEEDWMYTNAVHGAIHDPSGRTPDQKSIFHKYCYDTVMANSKHITPEHLIPGTPQSAKPAVSAFETHGGADVTTDLKRGFEANSDSDDDDDDVKRIKTE